MQAVTKKKTATPTDSSRTARAISLPKGVGTIASSSDGIALVVGLENIIHAGAVTVQSLTNDGQTVETAGLIYRSIQGVA